MNRAGSARDGGSYRDPSGFVFWHAGEPYRQVNARFADDWKALHSSGLLKALTDQRLLVEHELASPGMAQDEGAIAVIKPRALPFISYPYEWCFSQLKDAALLTLRVQELAVEHGMTLRDASAYNVQFEGRTPILIDTLSFERLGEDATWKPYRQFCEHFLAPLALMSRADPRARVLLRASMDGVPLDLASRLLPASSRLNVGLLAHIHLHARSQAAVHDPSSLPAKRPMGRTRLLALIDGLRRTVQSLKPPRRSSTWSEYTPCTSYSDTAARSKERIVRELLAESGGSLIWDVGANDGHYSEIAAEGDASVVALDADDNAVERMYARSRSRGGFVLPLVMDLANPSPALGWNLEERRSLFERSNADLVMALALVHHLAIGHNLPLGHIASFFARLAPRVILEWVPKSDPMTQRLLASREDIFAEYTLTDMRAAFAPYFVIDRECPVEDSDRILLGMRRIS